MDDLKLALKHDVPDVWLTEAHYATGIKYISRGVKCDCEVIVRWRFADGAIDGGALARKLGEIFSEEGATVEDMALALASEVACACKGWFQVQLRSEVPGAEEPLTVIVKRSKG